MSAGLPSDEVAKDYKESLDDLAINSKYEIGNLTIIARENTEHALAISRVLENHINKTSPSRKLPALYLLDSIVKNAGTPYTLYFGRNLYNTFMGAYASVNEGTRRKLDEMLETWKRPVPGSLDPRPVFPVEVTTPIENGLLKARTAFVQQHQQQQFKSQQELARGRGITTPLNGYRNTPTPPQMNGHFNPPQAQGFQQPNFPPQILPQQHYPNAAPNGHYPGQGFFPNFPQQPPSQQVQLPYQQPFQQAPPQQYQQPIAPQYSPPGPNLGILHRDVDSLIRSHRADLTTKPYDPDVQPRLSALLDLQTILRTGQLPPEQVQQVRNQVDSLMASSASSTTTPVSTTLPYPIPSFPPQQTPTPAPVPHPAPPPVDLSSLLASNNLADIIARAQRASATPPTAHASLAQERPQLAASTLSQTLGSIPAAASGGLDLIASLRTAGLLTPSISTPTPPTPPYNAPPAIGKRGPGPAIDVPLNSASLKIPRPQLISYLYDAQPNQCTTCGRRFLATEEGRAKKARHLDWHFRTNQRIADSANRGQSRSWYVDEMEWIKSRDDPEATTNDPSSLHPNGTLAGTKAAAVDPKTKYIPVPSDQQLVNLPCPICQEKFETVWNNDVQDFVWMDAIKVGGRVYHASCHSEVIREEGARTPVGAGGRTGTPDSVLGKRKADIQLEGLRA